MKHFDLTTQSGMQDAAKTTGMMGVWWRCMDVFNPVVAAEKADIALQLTLQVRNKAVEAYQEIMRMQV